MWATYDTAGQRLEHNPADPLDPVFYLRRPRGRAVHAWRLFRTRPEAQLHVRQSVEGDEDAARWALDIPASDFDDLIRRFGAGPGS